MNQTNKIAAAVEPHRQIAVSRARASAAEFVQRAMAQLTEAGNDLNVVAPRPHSKMSRPSYVSARRRRDRFISLCKRATEGQFARNKESEFIVRDDAKIAQFIEDAAYGANASFDGFVAKLTAKIGDGVVDAKIDSGYVWQGSILTVEKIGNVVEKWKTQMILNVSVLGTLFNQWPTRKIGGRS